MAKCMITLISAIFAVGVFAAAPQPAATATMTEALQPYVDNGDLPGAISIMYRDGVEERCCLGYADPRSQRKITADDVYMQCSQTKGFCGVTIAKLVEEGRLNLDDPVSKYLPEFKTLWVRDYERDGVRLLRQAKNVLTVRMCLNHTGGFPFETSVKNDAVPTGGWSGGSPLRPNAACAAASPLLFEPGTGVQYSNTGIDIGAAVVEVITGMRWEDYLQKTVLDPLGMASSGFWPTDEQLAHQVELYKCHKGGKPTWLSCAGNQQRPYNDRSRVFASAGAGLWTTANDQYKFYKMLMNLGVGDNGVRILKEETVKQLLAVSTRPLGKQANGDDFGGYSLGLWAPVQDGEDEWFGHGGAWGTSCMVNWHRKELKLWVVQLCGAGDRNWSEAKAKVEDRFFRHQLDAEGEKAYTGRLK